jgi:hypothetical protein
MAVGAVLRRVVRSTLALEVVLVAEDESARA